MHRRNGSIAKPGYRSLANVTDSSALPLGIGNLTITVLWLPDNTFHRKGKRADQKQCQQYENELTHLPVHSNGEKRVVALSVTLINRLKGMLIFDAETDFVRPGVVVRLAGPDIPADPDTAKLRA